MKSAAAIPPARNPDPPSTESTIKITSRSFALGAALLLLGSLLDAPAAAPVKIRLATLAPKDSSPHKSLQQMGEAWKKSTGDQVQLTLFTDGTMGGEADMVRRMRIGQIQAAMLTAPASRKSRTPSVGCNSCR